MNTERGLDRLTFFTDAIAAIAITLLILPLVDSVPEGSAAHVSVGRFLSDNHNQIIGFLISFVVIARLWIAHHSMFEHVRAYDSRLMGLSLLWGFTVVVLPLPTSIIAQFHVDRAAVALYVGTMTLSSLTLTTIAIVIARTPRLQSEENPVGASSLAASAATSVLFVISLVVGIASPSINLWALFLLWLSWPLQVVFERRLSARSNPPKASHSVDAHVPGDAAEPDPD